MLCLGNDLLRDDGVGWAVADALERALPDNRAAEAAETVSPFLEFPNPPPQPAVPNPQPATPSPRPPAPDPLLPAVTVRRSALSGFYLLDELTGWERAVVVDAVQTGRHPPGTVLSFPFEALRSEAGPSPHAVGLPTVVRLGRQSGVPLPGWIHIVAVETEDMVSCAEGLTPAVAHAVPAAVDAVMSVLALAPGAGHAVAGA